MPEYTIESSVGGVMKHTLTLSAEGVNEQDLVNNLYTALEAFSKYVNASMPSAVPAQVQSWPTIPYGVSMQPSFNPLPTWTNIATCASTSTSLYPFYSNIYATPIQEPVEEIQEDSAISFLKKGLSCTNGDIAIIVTELSTFRVIDMSSGRPLYCAASGQFEERIEELKKFMGTLDGNGVYTTILDESWMSLEQWNTSTPH